MRSVMEERGSDASVVHHGRYADTFESSDAIVPSSTSAATIIADGHLDVEPVGICVAAVKLPPSYLKRVPLSEPITTAYLRNARDPRHVGASVARQQVAGMAARRGLLSGELPAVEELAQRVPWRLGGRRAHREQRDHACRHRCAEAGGSAERPTPLNTIFKKTCKPFKYGVRRK